MHTRIFSNVWELKPEEFEAYVYVWALRNAHCDECGVALYGRAWIYRRNAEYYDLCEACHQKVWGL